MALPIDPATAAVGGTLLGLIAYFLRKTDKKVDANAEKLELFRADIVEFKGDIKTQISTMRDDLKEDMIEIFNDTCHERQGSCSRLQDTKMAALEAREHTICAKIAKLESDRREDWGEQRRWNQRWEDKLSPAGGHKK